jgi:hypothetical protein
MDSHFNEYLAAVAGMQEVYGHPADDHPTDFHDGHEVANAEEAHGLIATVSPAAA